MSKKIETKTNAMRLLDAAGLAHEVRMFSCPEALSGVEVARMLGEDPDHVFKTLVTVGANREHYVFMVPVACELDLKKAAHAAGVKSIQMIKSRELLPLTGYVHGGCSPLGMKKQFATFIDESAEMHETILFSGGRIGTQVEMSLATLQEVLPVTPCDLIAW